MQFYRVLASVLFVVVPVLGLTSCSKDKGNKASSADAPVEDSWQMTAPMVLAGATLYTLEGAKDRTLPGDSTLEFKGDRWISMTVTSNCKLNDVAQEPGTFTLTYRDSLQLKSLYPRTLTPTFTNEQLRHLTCKFDFTTQNEIGSTQDFSLTDVQLSDFSSADIQKTLTANSQPIAFGRRASGTQIFVDMIRGLGTSIDLATDISFVCGDQAATSPYHSDPESVAAYFFSQMHLTGDQNCHLLASKAGTDTNQFVLTDEISFRFSAPRLALRQDNTFTANPNDKNLFRLVIQNGSSEMATFQIPSGQPVIKWQAVLDFAPSVISWDHFRVAPIPAPAQAQLNVGSLNPISSQAGYDSYQIAAGAEASISVLLPDNWVTCFSRAFIPATQTFSTVGIRYGFISALSVIQQNYNGEPADTLWTAPAPQGDWLPTSILGTRDATVYGTSTVPDTIPGIGPDVYSCN